MCAVTALAAPAFAGNVFLNPGFEAGDSTDWTLHSGTWNSSSQTTNDSHQGDSAVITGSGHTDSNTSVGLQTVLSGNDSFR